MKNDHILTSLVLVDKEELELQLEKIINDMNPTTIGFLNQHAYNLMCKDVAIKNCFMSMDYMFRDGKGIELACRHHNIAPKLNLNGTDLIPLLVDKLIARYDNIDFFAYGTKSPWLDAGASALFNKKSFLSLDGFKSDASYVDHYKKHQTENVNVIVLAMGMPKQERIARLLKQESTGKVIIICGGAILDFQAGRVQRAPSLFRKLGIEWLYRLLCEPKRLFSRYVIGIPIFFWNVHKTKNS